jgi:hypothetical protein
MQNKVNRASMRATHGINLEAAPLEDLRLPVDGVRLLGGGVVLLVDLDRLVRLAGDEPRAGVVELHLENARLRVQRAGLDGRLEPLEVVPGPPVPEEHRPVVRARHHHPVRVDSETVDDCVVAGEVLDELPLGTLPLFDVVGAGRGEHVQLGVEAEAAHGLLVVGERGHGLPGRQVPQADRCVVARSDHLEQKKQDYIP